MEIKLWKVSAAMVHRDEEYGRVERSWDHLYDARDAADAIESGVRWAKRMMEVEREISETFLDLGCVKVWGVSVGRMDENGYGGARNCFDTFEWKYDWGYSLDEAVASEIVNQQKVKVEPKFTFDDLVVSVTKLKGLLDDPQNGLMAWCEMYGETMTEIVEYWRSN